MSTSLFLIHEVRTGGGQALTILVNDEGRLDVIEITSRATPERVTGMYIVLCVRGLFDLYHTLSLVLLHRKRHQVHFVQPGESAVGAVDH